MKAAWGPAAKIEIPEKRRVKKEKGQDEFHDYKVQALDSLEKGISPYLDENLQLLLISVI